MEYYVAIIKIKLKWSNLQKIGLSGKGCLEYATFHTRKKGRFLNKHLLT